VHRKASAHRLGCELDLTGVRGCRYLFDPQRGGAQYQCRDDLTAHFFRHLRGRRRRKTQGIAQEVRIFIHDGLKPAGVRIFHHALPIRLAPEFRANGLDDFGVIEQAEKRPASAGRSIPQGEATDAIGAARARIGTKRYASGSSGGGQRERIEQVVRLRAEALFSLPNVLYCL